MTLLEKLKDNTKKPYHMPGHKRQGIAEGLPYDIDITEIEGFDNLHELSGVLKDVADRASRIYGTKYSFPWLTAPPAASLQGYTH